MIWRKITLSYAFLQIFLNPFEVNTCTKKPPLAQKNFMKKLYLTVVAGLMLLFTNGQYGSIQFIDSLADKINSYNTILLFTELRDTTNAQTNQTYTQRTSYYFDWHKKELRYIEVYDFDKKLNWRSTEKAFKKQRTIPSSTRTVYTFLNNNLVKVKLNPSQRYCQQCSGEYYFGGMLIFKNEIHMPSLNRSFVNEANWYLTRLQIAKKGEDMAY